ncbi:MAG: translation initiation factor IF-3 [Clostridiales bacterium]|jgi:translation initiation factor IF-3|nr:translation initiation factor IF-3 [Clostridiales bacterium]
MFGVSRHCSFFSCLNGFCFRRQFFIKGQRVELNYRIRDPQVRVLDDKGEQIGIMTSQEANRLADSRGLDLAKINPGSNPPVCKIMDYGKFKFDAVKREKEQKKHQKNSEMREMRLSMNIDKHDLETKARQTKKLLTDGDKVKVSIRMRGREQAHAKLGVTVMNNFFALCEDVSVIDIKAHTEGRNIFMILTPKKLEAKSNKSRQPKTDKKISELKETSSQNKLQQNLGDKLKAKLNDAEEKNKNLDF